MAKTNSNQKKVKNSKPVKKVDNKNISSKKAITSQTTKKAGTTTTVKITTKKTRTKQVTTKPIVKTTTKKVFVKPATKKIVSQPTTKKIVSQPPTKPMVSNSIEDTGPILTGAGFVSDKILFSGEVENIPTQAEDEEEKRSKWNTNATERKEAVLRFHEAQKRMKVLLSEHWDKKSKTITKKMSPKIKNEIKEIQNKFGIQNQLTESLLPKDVPETKGKNNSQKSKNAFKVDKEFEKTRMTVKSFDQISEDLKPGKKLSEDIEITPFSNFIEQKDVDNTVSNELFKKINAFSDTEIKILGNQINNYLHKDEVNEGNNNTVNNNSIDSKSYEEIQSLEKKSKDSGLATIEEMSDQQVGGVGKPGGKLMSNYDFKINKESKYLKTKKQPKEVSFQNNLSVSKEKEQKKNTPSPAFFNEFQNQKPEIKPSKELKKQMKKSYFNNPMSKKDKGTNISALEQMRKQRGTPGGWRNPNNINDDGLSNVDSRNRQEDSLGKQPSHTMSQKNPYTSNHLKKEVKKHKPKHHKHQKQISIGNYDIKDVEKNISEQMTRLDKFDFEGLSSKKDFGGIYHSSLGKDASDMIKFRNDNLQNVNKNKNQNKNKIKRRK